MSADKLFQLLFRPLSIGISDEKQLMRAWLKSRRDERSQTGVLTPGRIAKQKNPRRGNRDRSRLNLNMLDVLSPFLGFCFVDALVPGGSPPAVFFRALGAYLADNNKKKTARKSRLWDSRAAIGMKLPLSFSERGHEQKGFVVQFRLFYPQKLSRMPAATALPMTPATLGPIACIRRKLRGSAF